MGGHRKETGYTCHAVVVMEVDYVVPSKQTITLYTSALLGGLGIKTAFSYFQVSVNDQPQGKPKVDLVAIVGRL